MSIFGVEEYFKQQISKKKTKTERTPLRMYDTGHIQSNITTCFALLSSPVWISDQAEKYSTQLQFFPTLLLSPCRSRRIRQLHSIVQYREVEPYFLMKGPQTSFITIANSSSPTSADFVVVAVCNNVVMWVTTLLRIQLYWTLLPLSSQSGPWMQRS